MLGEFVERIVGEVEGKAVGGFVSKVVGRLEGILVGAEVRTGAVEGEVTERIVGGRDDLTDGEILGAIVGLIVGRFVERVTASFLKFDFPEIDHHPMQTKRNKKKNCILLFDGDNNLRYLLEK